MRLIGSIHGLLWGFPGIALILLSGVYLTIRSGFVQLRLFPYAVHSLFEYNYEPNHENGSAIQAFFTALGSTVGTGNLIGVAGAICLGGPGSVFWMWICAFFAMAVKYAEAFLAVRYRHFDSDGIYGGVMYSIRFGMGERYRLLSQMYCVLCVLASLGIGSMVQMNAIVGCMQSLTFNLGFSWSNGYALTISVLITIAFLLTVRNGSNGIGAAAQLLVPFAGGGYVLLCVAFLLIRIKYVPDSIQLIFSGAFHPGAVTGGLVGSVLQTLCVGCRRGVFSNEAGLGTATMAHAMGSSNPVKQGSLGILEVFADTIVICTLTALVVLSGEASIVYGTENSANLLLHTFQSVFGLPGHFLLTAIIIVLSFATIIGWGLYGSSCMTFLFGKESVFYYFCIQAAGLLFGAVVQSDSVWMLAETANAMLMIPNLCALLILGREVCALTKDLYPAAGVAKGGTYANIHQCKPLRTVAHEKIPSSGGCG